MSAATKIHHDQFHTNDDGTLSWEEVECLGACVNAPMVMIFKDTYEDLTPERLGEIIDAFAAGKGAGVPAGPQIDRIVSAPQSGLTTLRDEKAVLKSTRDKEAEAEAAAAAAAMAATPAPAAATPPPSNAAKPKTDAPETSAAIKSPSEVKVAPAAEAAAGAPKLDAANANKTSEPVETTSKPAVTDAPASAPAQALNVSTAAAGETGADRPEPPGRNRQAGKAGRSETDLRRRSQD